MLEVIPDVMLRTSARIMPEAAIRLPDFALFGELINLRPSKKDEMETR
jgi:hypothetical protein